MGETLMGKVETPKEIVETWGETCGNSIETIGNGYETGEK